MQTANNNLKNKNEQLIESKIKLDELINTIKESKNIMKQYDKDKIRLIELEKIFNQCQNLKNENKNILKDIKRY